MEQSSSHLGAGISFGEVSVAKQMIGFNLPDGAVCANVAESFLPFREGSCWGILLFP